MYNGIDVSYINKPGSEPARSNGGYGQKIEQNFEPVQNVSATCKDESNLSLMGADESLEQPIDSVLATYLDRDYWERKRREVEVSFLNFK
jgi:hypothetical protein